MNLSSRLKIERERLGYSQTAFASVASASKHAQINWEKGVAAPNATNLAAWAEVGLDVLFVVLGERDPSTLDLDGAERVLLTSYRQCKPEGQAHLIQTAALLSAGLAPGPAPSPKRSGSGSVTVGDMRNDQSNGVQVGYAGGDVEVNKRR